MVLRVAVSDHFRGGCDLLGLPELDRNKMTSLVGGLICHRLGRSFVTEGRVYFLPLKCRVCMNFFKVTFSGDCGIGRRRYSRMPSS